MSGLIEDGRAEMGERGDQAWSPFNAVKKTPHLEQVILCREWVDDAEQEREVLRVYTAAGDLLAESDPWLRVEILHRNTREILLLTGQLNELTALFAESRQQPVALKTALEKLIAQLNGLRGDPLAVAIEFAGVIDGVMGWGLSVRLNGGAKT